ncbi:MULTISPECIES: HEPN domain-containing protein [unclassified Sphingobacterium]|uniref:HEPN domain-containing protein n=1 Tax=unclassified Sphingobacterium TaxID=2609468 RepID=UPI0010538F6E|nr:MULTISPECIES: HEPN domain-containing protein [unclassified Sphingobacterium]MCS3552939.1 sulfite reductase (ferredoxin) [Sphingobacterium sp. JUb21]TCR10307.1 sulfite reductase (ferredoxin) [Sphingobacterium sp. JUb20]
MQSFRTELENPVVEQEIIDLEKKIRLFQEGKITDEKFRSLRLARGVYGQRQPGVQMVRIKLPFGKATFKQVIKISDVSDEYAIRNLHITTRQDIQIHFVSLDRTPELWAKLAEDDITLREACGNTVRNVTASPTAGIDPQEPFDVSPYAQAVFEFCLRNPICAEMGRKFKMSFSSSDDDTAFSYIHDLGFIPKIQVIDGKEERGFKVLLGGGLGSQPFLAHLVHEFLHEDQLIPFVESSLRVFDRYGERNNRNKARFKYLIQKLGIDEVLRLIAEERVANHVKSFQINRDTITQPTPPDTDAVESLSLDLDPDYLIWKSTNTFEQKQQGFYGVFAKISTGDLPTEKARVLVAGLEGLVADEIRFTQNQGLLLKYATEKTLPHIFKLLTKLELASPGFESTSDVTTCPGTDTCNLGISNSTEMARVIESYIRDFYADFVYNRELKIKISGCMNSCGQHGLAHLGFHGSSVKANGKVVPAAQVMIGGGTVGDGVGRVAERIIKVPTKRVLHVVDLVLTDYKKNVQEGENFHAYYDRQTKNYFYTLLKPLADLTTLSDDEYIDWGHQETFETAIGVGECAGVMIDLVATLIFEAEEKRAWAVSALEEKKYADAIYHAYSTFIGCAKALLLDKGVNVSSQHAVIQEFQAQFVEQHIFELETTFPELVLQINKNEPTPEFAENYLESLNTFFNAVYEYRNAMKVN